MNSRAGLNAPAALAGPTGRVSAAEFSDSYVEVTVDLEKTGNTAMAPLEDEANGRFIGNAGLWEVPGPFHEKGSWSREIKGVGTVGEPGRNAKARSSLDRVIPNTGWTDLCRMLDVKAANAITVNPACTSKPAMNSERLTAATANPKLGFTARPAAKPITPT